jgi:biopolymer transport protein ExbD
MRLTTDRHRVVVPRLGQWGRWLNILILLTLTGVLVHTVRLALAHPPRDPRPASPAGRHAILTIHADGRWTLDGRLVPPDDLEVELARVFADRPVKVLFVTATPDRTYGEVLAVGERARAAGIATVGYLPPTP